MGESSPSNTLNDAPQKTPSPATEELTELRTLILGSEQTQLGELQERLDNPQALAQDLSRALPEAIVLRAHRDGQLATALLPTVEEALQASVKKDPQALIDSISPVMGPATRKAISQALDSMLLPLNQTLKYSLSLQGLQWRLEGWRTGKPFAEVVLSHTLLYRVEQIFLIHKKTGLLLQHVVAEAAEAQDADMVSGMLTAIQDFVQDSFGVQQGTELDALNVGELTVWIERGPQAILAAVIRGSAPQELRSVLQTTIEAIHLEQREALASFEGDATPFAAIRPSLEACLLEAENDPARPRRAPLVWLFLGLIVLPLSLWAGWTYRENQRWAEYLRRLNAESGIVITSAEKRDGKYFVSGLRDPLAADPTAILKQTRLDRQKVVSRWEPYQALSPEFVLDRAKALLEPPKTVTLELHNGTLSATGSAPPKWIANAQRLARAIAGVTQFKDDELTVDLSELELRKEQVDEGIIRFVVNTTKLAPNENETLRAILADIQRLYKIAPSAGQQVRLEIIGHSSSEGTEKRNIELSQERADLIKNVLISNAIPAASLTAVGAGTGQPLREELTDQDKTWNRSVSFRVFLTNTPESKG